MTPVLTAVGFSAIAGLVQIFLAVETLPVKMGTLAHAEVTAIAFVQLFRAAAGRVLGGILLSGIRIAFAHRSRSFHEFCLLEV
jgi:hypothetical protein